MADTNKKPNWCPHANCIVLTCFQDKMCSGKMPKPEPHDNDFNTHRLCLKDSLPNNEIFDLQVNRTDMYHFGLIFDGLMRSANAKEII